MKIWCDECSGKGHVTRALSLGEGVRGIGAVRTEMCKECRGKGYTNEAVVKVSEVLKKLDVECGLYGANSGVLNVVDWLDKKEQEAKGE